MITLHAFYDTIKYFEDQNPLFSTKYGMLAVSDYNVIRKFFHFDYFTIFHFEYNNILFYMGGDRVGELMFQATDNRIYLYIDILTHNDRVIKNIIK